MYILSILFTRQEHQANNLTSERRQGKESQLKEIEMAANNKILIFLGTVRPQRMVDRVATAVKELVASHGMEPELMGRYFSSNVIPFSILLSIFNILPIDIYEIFIHQN